jgi:hypothetical protein
MQAAAVADQASRPLQTDNRGAAVYRRPGPAPCPPGPRRWRPRRRSPAPPAGAGAARRRRGRSGRRRPPRRDGASSHAATARCPSRSRCTAARGLPRPRCRPVWVAATAAASDAPQPVSRPGPTREPSDRSCAHDLRILASTCQQAGSRRDSSPVVLPAKRAGSARPQAAFRPNCRHSSTVVSPMAVPPLGPTPADTGQALVGCTRRQPAVSVSSSAPAER